MRRIAKKQCIQQKLNSYWWNVASPTHLKTLESSENQFIIWRANFTATQIYAKKAHGVAIKKPALPPSHRHSASHYFCVSSIYSVKGQTMLYCSPVCRHQAVCCARKNMSIFVSTTRANWLNAPSDQLIIYEVSMAPGGSLSRKREDVTIKRRVKIFRQEATHRENFCVTHLSSYSSHIHLREGLDIFFGAYIFQAKHILSVRALCQLSPRNGKMKLKKPVKKNFKREHFQIF